MVGVHAVITVQISPDGTPVPPDERHQIAGVVDDLEEYRVGSRDGALDGREIDLWFRPAFKQDRETTAGAIHQVEVPRRTMRVRREDQVDASLGEECCNTPALVVV